MECNRTVKAYGLNLTEDDVRHSVSTHQVSEAIDGDQGPLWRSLSYNVRCLQHLSLIN